MRIYLPRRVVSTFDAFHAWGYAPLYRRGGFTLRRVDPLIVVAFLVCVGWYGWTSGWVGAGLGALMFILMAMAALWL